MEKKTYLKNTTKQRGIGETKLESWEVDIHTQIEDSYT